MENQQAELGKWYATGRFNEWYAQEFICGKCGGYMLGQVNYCPHCGKKMLVEKEWKGHEVD